MALTINAGYITAEGDDGLGGTGGAPPAGTCALVAGALVHIIHLDMLLPAHTGDVAKMMQLVTLTEQQTQAEQLFAFLRAPNPALS